MLLKISMLINLCVIQIQNIVILWLLHITLLALTVNRAIRGEISIGR